MRPLRWLWEWSEDNAPLALALLLIAVVVLGSLVGYATRDRRPCLRYERKTVCGAVTCTVIGGVAVCPPACDERDVCVEYGPEPAQ